MSSIYFFFVDLDEIPTLSLREIKIIFLGFTTGSSIDSLVDVVLANSIRNLDVLITKLQ